MDDAPCPPEGTPDAPLPAAGRRPSVRPDVPTGAFTRRAALAAGWTTGQLDTELRAGRLLTVRRGVYRSASAPLPPIIPPPTGPLIVTPDGPRPLLAEGREPDRYAQRRAELWAAARAAAAATGDEVAVTHEAAAAYHGLWLVRPWTGPPTVSRVRVKGEGRPGGTAPAPLVSELPRSHLIEVDGVLVSMLERTAVDLARRGDPLLAVVAMDSALRLGATRESLRRVVEECRGWPGVRLAREMVEFADDRSESGLESMARWRFHEFGWEPPEPQAWLRGLVDHSDVRVDHAWLRRRVVGEADGMLKYDEDRFALRKEKRREDAIREDGFEVFRYTYDETVYRPEDLRRKGERVFERAARNRAS
ncbi:MAG: hypothetical protein Q8R60_10975 [Mycobacteriales bacterium]|nr:hypothetical protein [Mycobacteriales bacterium]